MKRRTERQQAIRKVVREERIRTQRDLVDRLEALGFSCTQATVSRDIADLGVQKLPEGGYVLAEDLHLQRMLTDLVADIIQADNLVIVKASTGTAPGVAAALDAAGLDGVLGSVAGDDTVLMIAADAADAAGVVARLRMYRHV
jgi:transcriptional regulator of arginine metabolism